MLTNLAGLAQDEAKLKEIGSRIVREAMRQAASERLALKAENPDVIRIVRIGDRIPGDLLREIDIRDGVAASGWEKTWTNLGIWDRNWSEAQSDQITNPGRLSDLRTTLRAQVVFSPEELRLIQDMQLLER